MRENYRSNDRSALRTRRVAIAAAVGALLCACGPGDAASTATSGTASIRLAPVDLLIFAPHPDDEVIGVGGVLQQALAGGQRVRIVFATNGDGYGLAAAAMFHKAVSALVPADYLHLAAARQREAIAAARVLGLRSSNLVFLGYPDGALASVYSDVGVTPVQSPTTNRTATYGPVEIDYHTRAHGRPAPYNLASAQADFEEILNDSQPRRVYVTDRADQHSDHKATYALAYGAISAVGYRGPLLTFLVHGGQGWPWPQGLVPGSQFESHIAAGIAYPVGVPWPPPVRVHLTAAQTAAKERALAAYFSQWEVDRQYLESFAKSEEVFWTGF